MPLVSGWSSKCGFWPVKPLYPAVSDLLNKYSKERSFGLVGISCWRFVSCSRPLTLHLSQLWGLNQQNSHLWPQKHNTKFLYIWDVGLAVEESKPGRPILTAGAMFLPHSFHWNVMHLRTHLIDVVVKRAPFKICAWALQKGTFFSSVLYMTVSKLSKQIQVLPFQAVIKAEIHSFSESNCRKAPSSCRYPMDLKSIVPMQWLSQLFHFISLWTLFQN